MCLDFLENWSTVVHHSFPLYALPYLPAVFLSLHHIPHSIQLPTYKQTIEQN